MARRPRPGTICAYCALREATTWDHVFARQFFVEGSRGNLPQVPACEACNNAKSAEELYLTAAMPFGGRHAHSGETLASVERRLAGNRRLHQELAAGMERDPEENLVVPFDSSRLCRLFEWIARGLYYFHWGAPLPCACAAKAIMLTPEGRDLFDALMNAQGDCVENDVGVGTFTYRGLRDSAAPEKTVWQLTPYGGLLFADAPGGPVRIDVLTGPPDFLALIPD